MALKFGKREVTRMAAALDAEHETVEDAAAAALEVAEEIFADRAQYVVVGQLSNSKARLSIPPDDPEAVRLSLGWYSTEGEARKAAESLWHNTASGDTFRTWVLPVHHGTPADFHGKRKQYYIEKQAKAKAEQAERFKQSIADVDRRMAERLAEIRAIEAAANGQQWPCPASVREQGKCMHRPTCK